MRLPIITLLVSSASVYVPLANASCDPPSPGVVWQFPADGATEVPTNTTIWLIAEETHGVAVSLNGKALTRSASRGPERHKWVGHGPLAPRTTYEIALEQTMLWEYLPSRVETTFTTGAGPVFSAPAEPDVSAVDYATSEHWKDASFPDVPTSCLEIAFAQGCHDQGQLGWISLATTTRPAFWTADSDGGWHSYAVVWPGECGAPALIDASSEDGRPLNPCRVMTAMDAAGQPLGSRRFCVEDFEVATLEPEPGCQSSPKGTTGLPLTLVVLLLIHAGLGRRRVH